MVGLILCSQLMEYVYFCSAEDSIMFLYVLQSLIVRAALQCGVSMQVSPSILAKIIVLSLVVTAFRQDPSP